MSNSATFPDQPGGHITQLYAVPSVPHPHTNVTAQRPIVTHFPGSLTMAPVPLIGRLPNPPYSNNVRMPQPSLICSSANSIHHQQPSVLTHSNTRVPGPALAISSSCLALSAYPIHVNAVSPSIKHQLPINASPMPVHKSVLLPNVQNSAKLNVLSNPERQAGINVQVSVNKQESNGLSRMVNSTYVKVNYFFTIIMCIS